MTRFAKVLFLVALAGAIGAAIIAGGCSDEPPAATDRQGASAVATIDGGIFFPPAWDGEWNLVLTFRDCNNGNIVVEEDVVGTICPYDTLRLDFTGLFSRCDGIVNDTHLSALCEYDFVVSGCTVRVSFALDIDREGDAVTGSGIWSTSITGLCNGIYRIGCEQIEVSGVRLGPAPTPCDSSSSLPGLLTVRPRAYLQAADPSR